MKIVPWIFWDTPEEKERFSTIIKEHSQYEAMDKLVNEFGISLLDASKAYEIAKQRNIIK